MELLMLVGPPGSGKTTYSQKYAELGYKIHSSDEIRAELNKRNKIEQLKKENIEFNEDEIIGDFNDQSVSAEAFKKMFNRTIYDLKQGNNVIYDACNSHYKTRLRTLNSFKKILNDIDVSIVGIYFDVDKEECIKRNEKRQKEGSFIIDKNGNKKIVERNVPVEVIERMHDNLQKNPPSLSDGFDKIEVIKEEKVLQNSYVL